MSETKLGLNLPIAEPPRVPFEDVTPPDAIDLEKSADVLKDTLLTDDGKWWEFLDPETYDVKTDLPTATRESSDLIDWSKHRKTRKHGRLGFGFFSRCDSCGKPSPPDFTFCPHCGGTPRGKSSPKLWTIIVSDIEDDASCQAMAELTAESGDGLGVNEVYAMLNELPAVFNVYERRERVAAVTQKLAEIGVYSKSFPVSDPSIPWFRETIESILRDPVWALGYLAIVVGMVLTGIWGSALLVLLGVIVISGLTWHRFRWYQNRYEVNPNRLLDRLNGFDSGLAQKSQDLLKSIRDKEMREYLSICIMEYYTLHQQFRKHEAIYGDVLLKSEHALHELFEQILSASQRFVDLTFHIDGVEPAQLRARIRELRNRRDPNDPTAQRLLDQEIEHLKAEGRQYEKMVDLADRFRERMKSLTGSIEMLRVRMQSLESAEAARNEDVTMEEILAQLDEELAVFEQTFHTMEAR